MKTPVSKVLRAVLKSASARRELANAVARRGGIVHVGRQSYKVRMTSDLT